MQGVFCANFGYSQRVWPPCQECWNGYCLSSNPDRETYYYGVMDDVEGIIWNSNSRDELRYKYLNNGVHLFMPSLGHTCNFCNLQYRLPTISAKDRVFIMYITKCILDTGWGR